MSFDLNPETMIGAVERATGLILSGFTSQLTSYINRVYELRAIDGTKIIVKFYRPGRWSYEAISDEHDFLRELSEAEIPVVTPDTLKNGKTLDNFENILFAVFPKRAGRQMEINSWEDWLRLGTLVARVHNTGAQHPAKSRICINPLVSTAQDLDYLSSNVISPRYKDEYANLVQQVIDISAPLFKDIEQIRIHGDLHRGNILNRMDEGLLVIDFDDMAMGPPVQDLWLLLPDRLENSSSEVELFIEGYESFRNFRPEKPQVHRTASCDADDLFSGLVQPPN